MIFKQNKSLEVKNNLNYSSKIIWQNIKTWEIFLKVFWDLKIFKNKNPNIILLDDLPEWEFNFSENKFIETKDYKTLLKKIVREKIDEEIWDVYDLVADLSKKCNLLENIVFMLSDKIVLENPAYDLLMRDIKTITSENRAKFNKWYKKWDFIAEFDKLKWRNDRISEILKNNYNIKW